MNNYVEYDWAVQCNGQITFAGVLLKHYDAIAEKYHWSTGTKGSYAKDYENHILPRLQDRPLSEYTAEDFERVIYDISSEKHYKYSTLQHYRRLIKRVITFAILHEGLQDPLWGMYFDEVLTPNDVAQREETVLPRSLDPVMVWKMAEIIYNAVLESGEYTGLALLMESGLRLKESSATTYGDFRSFKDDETIPKVFIHNSTIGQTHNTRDGLKTDNGYRTAIISNKLALLLEEKQKGTEAMICRENTDVTHGITDICRVPMVHDKNDSFRHCASPQLTAAFRKLFTQVGYNEKDYLLLLNIINSEEFAEAVKRVTPKELGFAEEKDPSAYALRRHFNTEMHIWGVMPEDRQFAMGHKIENPKVKRSDYRNEDLLGRLAKQLNMRPYINPSALDNKTIKTSCYESDNVSNQDFEIPNKKGTLVIEFVGYDLLAPGAISIKAPDGTVISGKVYTQPLETPLEQSPSVIYDYLETYRRARDQVRAEKEAAMQQEKK